MTSWQEEQSRAPFGSASGDGGGRPLSRREAREAERRAAETMVEKPPHPSGVVDFEAHDFGPEFVPDQAFDVGDTQDIWQALTRGAQHGGVPRLDAGAPEVPAARTAPEGVGMSGDLMDRVRDAVLRRPAEPEPERPREQAVAPTPPPAFDPQAYDRRTLEPRTPVTPEPWQRPAAAAPQASVPQAYDSQSYDPQTFAPQGAEPPATRRQRRLRETADLREDGLPIELFAERRIEPEPVAAPRQPAVFDDYEDEQDGYYDEPYAPEPTIAIPVRAAALEPRAAGASPVGLPQAFSEPAGDDALTFSSPIAQVPVERYDRAPALEVDPEFIEPDRWEEEDEQQQFHAAHPKPASAPMPFIQPQRPDARFAEPQVGPPSELTDLAGFEALIRKARQQPPAPQPVEAPAPRGALSWADDDEDEQGGFGTLLNRQVQSSHGTSPALILPEDPQPVDLTQAVSGTGDIFVTGTMKLSRSLSTTGGHDELYDSPEIDRLYDVAHDEPASGVAPVRASKAVSGTAQNRSIVSGRPSRGNVLPTVLAIVAGAMAVGVVTLLVGSWLFHIF